MQSDRDALPQENNRSIVRVVNLSQTHGTDAGAGDTKLYRTIRYNPDPYYLSSIHSYALGVHFAVFDPHSAL